MNDLVEFDSLMKSDALQKKRQMIYDNVSTNKIVWIK